MLIPQILKEVHAMVANTFISHIVTAFEGYESEFCKDSALKDEVIDVLIKFLQSKKSPAVCSAPESEPSPEQPEVEAQDGQG